MESTQVAVKSSLPYGVSGSEPRKGTVGILDFEQQAPSNPDVHRLLAVTSVEVDADIERTDAPQPGRAGQGLFPVTGTVVKFPIVSIFRVVIRVALRQKIGGRTNCVKVHTLTIKFAEARLSAYLRGGGRATQTPPPLWI